jgi:cell shape-determining protein MreC
MTDKISSKKVYRDENGSLISRKSEYEKYKLKMQPIKDINTLKGELYEFVSELNNMSLMYLEIKNDISEIKMLLQEIKEIKNDNTSN